MVAIFYPCEAPSFDGFTMFNPLTQHFHHLPLRPRCARPGAQAPLWRLGGGARAPGGATAGTGGASDAALRAAGRCTLESLWKDVESIFFFDIYIIYIIYI